ncbi:PLP-dependent aminotransferase family protein [Orbaceae bacterium ac157xtp]
MWHKQQLNKFTGALYRKLSSLIEYYIEKGLLLANEQLPSERELAKRLQINRSTVVNALEVLAERGILIRKIGSGTYVNANKWGVLNRPIINWQLPAHFNYELSTYQQKANQLKLNQPNMCDLSNGDLPSHLIPTLTLPKLSAQELIFLEKNSHDLQLGLPSLKAEIAKYMQQQFSMQVNINEILITSGTQQALFLITQGLLKSGDAIGIEAPSYFYSLQLFQAAGIRLYGIKMDKEGILIDELEAIHKKQRLKWIFLNPIFQNPTGKVMSSQRKKQILEFCRQHYIGIVEDDAYSAINFDKIDNSPIKKYDKNNQVIYLGSLSKYLGKNIRIGWMIAPTNVIYKLSTIRQHIDSGLSILPQLLAEEFLAHHYQAHLQLLIKSLKHKRNELINWLTELDITPNNYMLPRGGYHLYSKLSVTNKKQEDALLLNWLTNKIIVAKGENFGDDFGMVRLSFGHFKYFKE